MRYPPYLGLSHDLIAEFDVEGGRCLTLTFIIVISLFYALFGVIVRKYLIGFSQGFAKLIVKIFSSFKKTN
jgi:hypothetical protein